MTYEEYCTIGTEALLQGSAEQFLDWINADLENYGGMLSGDALAMLEARLMLDEKAKQR